MLRAGRRSPRAQGMRSGEHALTAQELDHQIGAGVDPGRGRVEMKIRRGRRFEGRRYAGEVSDFPAICGGVQAPCITRSAHIHGCIDEHFEKSLVADDLARAPARQLSPGATPRGAPGPSW